MRPVEVRLLGRPEVLLHGGPVKGLTRKGLGLLAYLVSQGGRARRGRLTELLWDLPPEKARRNLRQEIYRLKKAGLAPYLEASPSEVALSGYGSDWEAFWGHYRGGRLEEALALVRGGFCQGLELPGEPSFEDWLYLERERLKEAVISAYLRLAERHREEDPERAAGLLEKALEWEPLLETAYQKLFPLLARLGRREEARELYRRLERAMESELGLSPSPETARQLEAALSGRPRLPESSPTPRGLDSPPLVERSLELDRLLADGPPLRWVRGAEGMGKTRLAREVFSHLGGGVWVNHTKSLSRLGFGALTAALSELPKEKLLALPEELRSELARLVPGLAPPPATPATDPEARVRFFEALASALARLGPVVALDDLHRADEAFLEFLPYLVRRARALGLVVVAASETPPPWELAAEGLVNAVELGPLSLAGVERLVAELSGSPRPRRFAARLYRATGGNPLFVVQTLKYLFQTGELRVGEGGWSTPHGPGSGYLELRLPPNVQKALLHRLLDLSPTAARVARFMFLAKAPTDPETAARALDLALEEAVLALEEAAEADLLTRTSRGYLPRYPELADTLPPELRRSLHRLWAAALKERGAHPLLVAEHLVDGGRELEAGRHYLMAARQARNSPAPAAAALFYRRAERLLPLGERERAEVELERLELETELGRDTLSQLEALAVPATSPRLEARRRLVAAEAALKKGYFDRAREHALAVLTSPAALRHQQARARFLLAWVEYRAGDPWSQRSHLNEALKAFEEAGDVRGASLVIRNLAALAFRLGDDEEGKRLQARLEELLREHPDPIVRRRLAADRLMGDWLHGRYYRALRGGAELLRDARRGADLPAQLDALELIGLAELKLGRYHQAQEALAQGLELARAVGSVREEALFLSELGLVAVETQNPEAREMLEAALASMRRHADQAKLGHALTALGYLELRRGRPERAVPWLEEAAIHYRRRGELGHAARALAYLALARDDPRAAREAREYAVAWRTGVPDKVLVLGVFARFFPEGVAEAKEALAAELALIPKELRGGYLGTYPARLVTAL